MQLLSNDTVSLYVYPEKKIVHHQIHKFIFGENFQNLMLAGVDAFEKHGCTKWLSDDRSNSALRKEDVEWGAQVWEPRVLKAGWKYWALVMPEMVVGQMNMSKLVAKYKSLGVTVQVFSDTNKAMAWLEQQ